MTLTEQLEHMHRYLGTTDSVLHVGKISSPFHSWGSDIIGMPDEQMVGKPDCRSVPKRKKSL